MPFFPSSSPSSSFSHFLPESPRYDLLQNREAAAHQTLRRVYGNVSEEYINLQFAALKEVVDISQAHRAKYNTWQSIKLIFRTPYLLRPAIVAWGLGIFQQLCGFNTLSEYNFFEKAPRLFLWRYPPARTKGIDQMFHRHHLLVYYSATIFAMAGFTNPTLTGLIVSGSNFGFTILAMFLLDRVGKRRLLLCTVPWVLQIFFAKEGGGEGDPFLQIAKAFGFGFLPHFHSFMVLGLVLAAVAFFKMTEHTGGQLIEGLTYPAKWSNMYVSPLFWFFWAGGS